MQQVGAPELSECILNNFVVSVPVLANVIIKMAIL